MGTRMIEETQRCRYYGESPDWTSMKYTMGEIHSFFNGPLDERKDIFGDSVRNVNFHDLLWWPVGKYCAPPSNFCECSFCASKNIKALFCACCVNESKPEFHPPETY